MVSPILGEIRDAVRYLSRLYRRRDDERAFVTYHTTDVADNGGTMNLHLKNPSDDTTIDVSHITITTQFTGTYRIYDQFSSAPSGGSAGEIDNLLMSDSNGPADDGVMESNRDVSFSSTGTPHLEQTVPSGGRGGSASGGGIDADQPKIQPGREIVIELTNTSTGSSPGSIVVTYTETTSNS